MILFKNLNLRNCYLEFSFQHDIHKLIENVVYLHLHSLYAKSLSVSREKKKWI